MLEWEIPGFSLPYIFINDIKGTGLIKSENIKCQGNWEGHFLIQDNVIDHFCIYRSSPSKFITIVDLSIKYPTEKRQCFGKLLNNFMQNDRKRYYLYRPFILEYFEKTP